MCRTLLLSIGVGKTRKVQVTLEASQFASLEGVARREGKKLAAVVRESVEKYCLEPESEQRKRQALSELFALEPAPVPESYAEWKREYGALKTKAATNTHEVEHAEATDE